jgi:hypothetical protein
MGTSGVIPPSMFESVIVDNPITMIEPTLRHSLRLSASKFT